MIAVNALLIGVASVSAVDSFVAVDAAASSIGNVFDEIRTDFITDVDVDEVVDG